MPNKNRKPNNSRRSLLVAIGAVSAVLIALIVLMICLMNPAPSAGDGGNLATQPNGSTTPSTPNPSSSDVTPTDPQSPDSNTPTDTAPILLSQDLFVVHVGNFSGRYVEDGSDKQLENFCAAIVENRSGRTVQLLQFQLLCGDQSYNFQLTTLPPGERAIVQELNRAAFAPSEDDMNANVDVCLFFEEEPSLHEDVFAVSGSENGLEIRNLTDAEIPGPIYVYYKTRTAEGYGGGITYRLTIPGLAANCVYNANANHFWPGSSQVMFIDYAD